MDICLWNKCNNRCLMCTNPHDFWQDDHYDYNSLKGRLNSPAFEKSLNQADSPSLAREDE